MGDEIPRRTFFSALAFSPLALLGLGKKQDSSSTTSYSPVWTDEDVSVLLDRLKVHREFWKERFLTSEKNADYWCDRALAAEKILQQVKDSPWAVGAEPTR